MTILMMFWMLFASAWAEDPGASIIVEETRPDYQVIQIYVDITEVHDPQGEVGTSMPLNIMIAEQAQRTSILEDRMHRYAGADIWNGEITVLVIMVDYIEQVGGMVQVVTNFINLKLKLRQLHRSLLCQH